MFHFHVYVGNKLYWCDAERHVIESANLDGSNRRILLNEANKPTPVEYFGLALDHEILYFTDWNRRWVNENISSYNRGSSELLPSQSVRRRRPSVNFPFILLIFKNH